MEYRELPGVNWSSLKHLRTSPLEYRFQLTHEAKDAANLRVGRAVHCLVLEPDTFDARHPLFEGASRRGKAWDAFQAEHPDADPLIESELLRVLGCAGAVRANSRAMELLSVGMTEHVISWTDPDTGVLCKGRCDLLNSHLVELKTTAIIDPRRFPGEVVRLGYHGQIAYYMDGLGANGLLPPDHRDPVVIAVESEDPHDVVIWRVVRETVEAGQCLYKQLLSLLDKCTRNNSWPGVAPNTLPLILPEWSMAELEESLTIHGVPLEV